MSILTDKISIGIVCFLIGMIVMALLIFVNEPEQIKEICTCDLEAPKECPDPIEAIRTRQAEDWKFKKQLELLEVEP